MPFRPGFLVQVVPSVLYTGAIFYLGSLKRDPTIQIQFEAKDKVLHLLAFFVMAVINRRAFAYIWPRFSVRRLFVVTFAWSSLLGALLEAYQSTLPYRSAEFLDWVFDSVGVGLALLWFKTTAGEETE